MTNETNNGWLIEWDGGFTTADTESEVQEVIDAELQKWADINAPGTRDDFTVSPNFPEAGDMSTSDGLGGVPISQKIAEREGVRQAVNEIGRPAEREIDKRAVQACFNLATYLNSQEEWNGGDVCEKLADELRRVGYTIN